MHVTTVKKKDPYTDMEQGQFCGRKGKGEVISSQKDYGIK